MNDIEQRIADLETVYWQIIDGALIIRQGARAAFASSFCVCRDPAGTHHWIRDHRTLRTAQLPNAWCDGPIPKADQHI